MPYRIRIVETETDNELWESPIASVGEALDFLRSYWLKEAEVGITWTMTPSDSNLVVASGMFI